MTRFIIASSVAIAVASPLFAGEEHHDIAIFLRNQRIHTGIEEGQNIFRERVFGAEFGPDIFNFTDEPGFVAAPGVFPPNTVVGFNILSALGVWNGDGFDVSPETLTISFANLSVTTGDGFVPGFGLDTDDEGGWHRHLGFTINDVEKTDSDIYLLELELWHENGFGFGGIRSSRPFWLVFNLNSPESEHDLAIEWVRENLVPAPGALALFAVGGLCVRRRRERG